MLARAPFPRARFAAKIAAHPVRRLMHAWLDREIALPAVLPSLPCDESQSRLRQFCSTNDSTGAQLSLCKPAALRRGLSVSFPNAARAALPLPPFATKCLCVSRPARARPDYDRFAQSPPQPASSAGLSRWSPVELSDQKGDSRC